MRSGKIIALILAAASIVRPSFGFSPAEQRPTERGGGAGQPVSERAPAEARDLPRGPVARRDTDATADKKTNNNGNIFNRAIPGAPVGESGVKQRDTSVLPLQPMYNRDGTPQLDSKGNQKEQRVPGPGFIVRSTPFRTFDGPAPQGFTRTQNEARFGDLTPQMQEKVKTGLADRIADLKSQGKDTSKLESALKQMDTPSEHGNIFVQFDADVSDTHTGAPSDIGRVKVNDAQMVDDNAVAAPPPLADNAPRQNAPADKNVGQNAPPGVVPGPQAPQQPKAPPAGQAPGRITGITITDPRTGQTRAMPIPDGMNIGVQRGADGKIQIVPLPKPNDGGAPPPAPGGPGAGQPGAAPVPQPNGPGPVPMPQLPQQGQPPAAITSITVADPTSGQIRNIPIPEGMNIGIRAGNNGRPEIVPMPPQGRGAAPQPQPGGPGAVPAPQPGGPAARGGAPLVSGAPVVVPGNNHAFVFPPGVATMPDRGVDNEVRGSFVQDESGGQPAGIPGAASLYVTKPAVGPGSASVVLPPAARAIYDSGKPLFITVPPNTFVGQPQAATLRIQKNDDETANMRLIPR